MTFRPWWNGSLNLLRKQLTSAVCPSCIERQARAVLVSLKRYCRMALSWTTTMKLLEPRLMSPFAMAKLKRPFFSSNNVSIVFVWHCHFLIDTYCNRSQYTVIYFFSFTFFPIESLPSKTSICPFSNIVIFLFVKKHISFSIDSCYLSASS